MIEGEIQLSGTKLRLAQLKVEDGERMLGFAQQAKEDMNTRIGILKRAQGYYKEALQYAPLKQYTEKLQQINIWIADPGSM